jgi:hypothetical protein
VSGTKRSYSLMVSAVAQKPATVCQKECVISKSRDIATSAFGPCYVLTGHDPKTKYNFLAHLDDMTQVESFSEIFRKLRGLGVKIQDLTNVRLMGGWKNHGESAKWGHKIIKVLKENNVPAPDLTHFHTKETRDPSDKFKTEAETIRFYYPGGVMKLAGDFSFFKAAWKKLEVKQMANDREYAIEVIARKLPQYADAVRSSPDLYQILSPQVLMDEKERPLSITIVD